MYPTLLGSCGSRPGIGRGVAIRRPRQIHLGHKVLIDDYAVLDVRGDGSKITLEDYVSIGRFSTVSAKNGSIHLASGVNVGSYTRIATQSSVSVGESTLIAAYCYIGPGNHQSGDGPLISQPMDIRGGVQIGSHSWIGAHTTIMDGVTIGSNTIIGAHSLVRESIPDNSVAFGVPARVASREKASLSD
jgi:acetyltransferase-like isoleucine patch superfamily enzyme